MNEKQATPVTGDDLDWSRSSPCADCPFLKSSPFHEGIASGVVTVMGAIEANQFAHTCHKTDNRPTVDGPRDYPGKAQHCAGAILMLLKTGRGMDLQIPLLEAAERGDLDLARMTAKAKRDRRVFTVFEYLRFYVEHVRGMAGGAPEGEKDDV